MSRPKCRSHALGKHCAVQQQYKQYSTCIMCTQETSYSGAGFHTQCLTTKRARMHIDTCMYMVSVCAKVSFRNVRKSRFQKVLSLTSAGLTWGSGGGGVPPPLIIYATRLNYISLKFSTKFCPLLSRYRPS